MITLRSTLHRTAVYSYRVAEYAYELHTMSIVKYSQFDADECKMRQTLNCLPLFPVKMHI
jgi:hypothetical protein